MGLSMCSQTCNRSRQIPGNFGAFKVTENWYDSEEETEEEEEYINFSRVPKVTSLPHHIRQGSPHDFCKTDMMNRAKTERVLRTRGYSLRERMKDRHRSSVVDREKENTAKQYANLVRDDTLKHLHHTVRIASSIVQKGTDINEELARQDRVLSKSENDISFTEYETNEITNTLKGMSSLTSKLGSTFRSKGPKKKARKLSEVNNDLFKGDIGLCTFSRMSSCRSTPLSETKPEDTHELQMKDGFGQLHAALDIITVQQLDTAWTLEQQEGRLTKFENKIDRTNNKISQQSQMMRRIMEIRKEQKKSQTITYTEWEFQSVVFP